MTWELRLAGSILPFVEGPVTESGMAWWRTGVFQGRGTEHVRPAGTHFHGTFAPLKMGNEFPNGRHSVFTAIRVAPTAQVKGTASVVDSITPKFRLAKTGETSFILTGPTTVTATVHGGSPGSPPHPLYCLDSSWLSDMMTTNG